ncbi:hypothetical protein BLNAU_2412 [Blattamonas nauphoetae]|uniref:Uncharacterized protein n=1 Tax=Blattamonas nauphoetae TaxID=2049346 RepID=A0ABQ9YFT1_9EUKA|nr:hypothetical protein BLNAU_2412 [Blattamonas nauphoetae]
MLDDLTGRQVHHLLHKYGIPVSEIEQKLHFAALLRTCSADTIPTTTVNKQQQPAQTDKSSLELPPPAQAPEDEQIIHQTCTVTHVHLHSLHCRSTVIILLKCILIHSLLVSQRILLLSLQPLEYNRYLTSVKSLFSSSLLVTLQEKHALISITIPSATQSHLLPTDFIELQLMHLDFQYESYKKETGPFWMPMTSSPLSTMDFVCGSVIVKDRVAVSPFDVILYPAHPEMMVRPVQSHPNVHVPSNRYTQRFHIEITNTEDTRRDLIRFRKQQSSHKLSRVDLFFHTAAPLHSQDIPVSHSIAFWHIPTLFLNICDRTIDGLLLFWNDDAFGDSNYPKTGVIRRKRFKLDIFQLELVSLTMEERKAIKNLALFIPPKTPATLSLQKQSRRRRRRQPATGIVHFGMFSTIRQKVTETTNLLFEEKQRNVMDMEIWDILQIFT